ncbi:MAG: hypothetical protein KJZ78_06885 [Bryobacteraceae bacterium]|nr:hypothetical protein [Bryobacteraceae bacterium]
MTVDVERLLAEALRSHGIRLDPHDPALVLVTLNRLVLEDVVRSIVREVRRATRDFEEAAGRVQSEFGATIARQVKTAADAVTLPANRNGWAGVYLGLGSAAGLFLAGMALGMWVGP